MSTDDLAGALKLAKTRTMFFAFVSKGLEGCLLVGKKKIPRTDINEAKKESGGKTVFEGQCQQQDGVLVFEVAQEAPGTLANAIKKTIKTNAGLTLVVEVRVNPTLNHSSQEETEITQAPIDPQAGQLIQRLNALSADIKNALAGPNKARVQSLFISIDGSIKSQNFTQAASSLDELQVLLEPNKAFAKTSDGTIVIARFKEIGPALKIALEQQIPHVAQIQRLSLVVGELLKSKQYEQADATLDELEPLIEELMVEEEPASEGTPRGASPKVAFARSRLEWQAAKRTVQDQLDSLRRALSDEYQDEQARKAADNVSLVVDQFNEGLGDLLDDLINETDAGKKGGFEERARGITERYLRFLESRLVALVEENPFAVTVTARATLGAPLRKLRGQLQSTGA